MSILIVVLLAVWLALSVVVQFQDSRVKLLQRTANLIRRYDFLSMVPKWALFAGPPTVDFELLYRDRLMRGELSVWRRIGSGAAPFCKGVWNPDKRRNRILRVLTMWLVRNAVSYWTVASAAKGMYLSFAYLNLAAHVSRAVVHSPTNTHTQFLVALSAGADRRKKPAIAFVSPFFRLSARSDQT